MDKSGLVSILKTELSKVITGQQYIIDRLLVGLLSNGHVLLEGVPGLAKTLIVKSMAQAVEATFSRIQFTPDLLPADVTGTRIYNQQLNSFEVRKGPVFAHFLLADEINRAPAKVQSALLEAMQERQVTIGDTTFPLEEPFWVLATQNPLEQEGTYPLPEAQVDRFMLKLDVDYPSEAEEQQIIRNHTQPSPPYLIQKVATIQDILEARQQVKKVFVDELIEKYIISIVFATRYPERYGLASLRTSIAYGASPRASINLALAAKALAFIEGHESVLPAHIKAVCKDVLRHRIGRTYEAEAEKLTSDSMIDTILNTVNTP